jgi:hypothetical protein
VEGEIGNGGLILRRRFGKPGGRGERKHFFFVNKKEAKKTLIY